MFELTALDFWTMNDFRKNILTYAKTGFAMHVLLANQKRETVFSHVNRQCFVMTYEEINSRQEFPAFWFDFLSFVGRC